MAFMVRRTLILSGKGDAIDQFSMIPPIIAIDRSCGNLASTRIAIGPRFGTESAGGAEIDSEIARWMGY
jgi:hypothetical protein